MNENNTGPVCTNSALSMGAQAAGLPRGLCARRARTRVPALRTPSPVEITDKQHGEEHCVVLPHDAPGSVESEDGGNVSCGGGNVGEEKVKLQAKSNRPSRPPQPGHRSLVVGNRKKRMSLGELGPSEVAESFAAVEDAPSRMPSPLPRVHKAARGFGGAELGSLSWFLSRREDDLLNVREEEYFPELDECSKLLDSIHIPKCDTPGSRKRGRGGGLLSEMNLSAGGSRSLGSTGAAKELILSLDGRFLCDKHGSTQVPQTPPVAACGTRNKAALRSVHSL